MAWLVALSVASLAIVGCGGGSEPAADANAPASEPSPSGAPPSQADRRPNVLVYLVDTLRSDHVGLYGYDRPTTPRLDALATESVVFERALAHTSWTRPAVASLFTGLYPHSHSVNTRDDALPRSAATLASVLREAGYVTAAVSTNGHVSPQTGFDRDFQRFEYLEEALTGEMHVQSDAANEVVFRWLEEAPPSRPFFLYVHTTDPHDPYTPRSPFLERLAPDVDPSFGARSNVRDYSHAEDLAESEVRHARAAFRRLYDAEIAFNDAQFGRLIDRLREVGLFDDTLLVFLSDHGEEFFEHGGVIHGHTLYAEMLRIPLLIRFPGGWRGGRRIEEIAEQVDLLPTILSFLGIPVPEGVQGRSLLPSIDSPGGESPDPWSVASLKARNIEITSLVQGREHLIEYAETPRHEARLELYDMLDDPMEQVDLAPDDGERARLLAGVLRALRSDAGISLAREDALLDPELEERLRALGYIR